MEYYFKILLKNKRLVSTYHQAEYLYTTNNTLCQKNTKKIFKYAINRLECTIMQTNFLSQETFITLVMFWGMISAIWDAAGLEIKHFLNFTCFWIKITFLAIVSPEISRFFKMHKNSIESTFFMLLKYPSSPNYTFLFKQFLSNI